MESMIGGSANIGVIEASVLMRDDGTWCLQNLGYRVWSMSAVTGGTR